MEKEVLDLKEVLAALKHCRIILADYPPNLMDKMIKVIMEGIIMTIEDIRHGKE